MKTIEVIDEVHNFMFGDIIPNKIRTPEINFIYRFQITFIRCILFLKKLKTILYTSEL